MSLDAIRRALEPDPVLYEKVVAEDVRWQSPIFTAKHLDVELSDASRGWRDVVLHRGGAGVVAVRDGRVCLVRQYRVAIGRVTLEIPAGKLDADEPGSACAARELAEETGLVAERLEHLATEYGAVGFTSEHTEVYYASGLTQHPAAPDEGELINAGWYEADDVVEAILAGLIQDSKTVVGVLAARAKGLL